jgi:hypothetical protein
MNVHLTRARTAEKNGAKNNRAALRSAMSETANLPLV